MTGTKGAMMERTTSGVAAAGVMMPAWLPELDKASVTAAQLVPILSAAWLAIQIIRVVARWGKRDEEG